MNEAAKFNNVVSFLWAIVRSEMLILEREGKDAENIKLPVCLWFAGRNNTPDPANITRLFAGETELSLVA